MYETKFDISAQSKKEVCNERIENIKYIYENVLLPYNSNPALSKSIIFYADKQNFTIDKILISEITSEIVDGWSGETKSAVAWELSADLEQRTKINNIDIDEVLRAYYCESKSPLRKLFDRLAASSAKTFIAQLEEPEDYIGEDIEPLAEHRYFFDKPKESPAPIILESQETELTENIELEESPELIILESQETELTETIIELEESPEQPIRARRMSRAEIVAFVKPEETEETEEAEETEEPKSKDFFKTQQITVSRSYRDSMLIEYPGLRKNKGYWHLLQHLLFGNWRDETSGEIVIYWKYCAEMEGKCADSNYSAKKFLDAFNVDVTQLCYRNVYSELSRKCRTIYAVNWSARAMELTKEEKRTFMPDDRVWLATGLKYKREHEATFRRVTQATALGRMEAVGCVEAYKLLTYLNNGAPNRFTSIKKHLDKARDKAIEVSVDIEQQLNILKQIEAQAQPFYEQGEKTTRIFSLNQSFLNLKREVREVMNQDWISCDLTSAQLAIVAKVWDIPELSAYLKSGCKIWPDLCEQMELEYNSENKSIMKTALYSIIFGAGRDRLIKQLSEDFPNGAKALKQLQEHYIIRLLFAARATQIRKIKRDGFGIDAFGKKYLLEYYQVSGKPYAYDSSRSIMAIVAQSYELKLLYPVVAAAIDSEEFDIVSWLHDGFCIAVKHKSKSKRITDKLKLLVKAEAKNLGIETELDVTIVKDSFIGVN